MGDARHSSGRFGHILLLFVFSIAALVLIPDFPGVLLGWDGLGLSSFFLVIYYQDSVSLVSGLITGLTNRVGDSLILASIRLWALSDFGTWGVLLILAAITKRAQFPFIRWLPAAMAAPTPVSSLVHSSTLVTAGVYLLLRWGGRRLFSGNPGLTGWETSLFILVRIFTLCLAGLCALYEFDLKKIIALSTLRQVAIMIVALAAGLPAISLYHLYTHAFFKALLFLCAGIVLHRLGIQDLRKIGSLFCLYPLVAIIMLSSTFRLCGMVFTRGYFSKEAIFFSIMGERASPWGINIRSLVLFYLALGLTVSYSARLSFLMMFGPSHFKGETQAICRPSLLLELPIMALAPLALLRGALIQFLGLNIPIAPTLAPARHFSPFIIIFLGLVLGFRLAKGEKRVGGFSSWANIFFGQLGLLKPLASQVPCKVLPQGPALTQSLDGGWIESLPQRTLYVEGSNQLFSYQRLSLWFILIRTVSLGFLWIN